MTNRQQSRTSAVYRSLQRRRHHALYCTNGAKYEAIVLPCTVAAAGDVWVEFTNGADVFVWKIPAATTFTSGSEYTYDITITRIGVSVTGSINICQICKGERILSQRIFRCWKGSSCR